MPKLTRRKVILAKTEATYKAATTPTAASDALIVNMGSSFDVGAEEIARNTYRDKYSPLGSIIASKIINIKIQTELRGGSKPAANILVPEYQDLLLACGMAETGNGTTGWIYTPVSDPANQKSCAIWWYEDGLVHKAIGCMGTWSLSMGVNQIGIIEFNMTGVYVDPLDIALPTPTILDLTPPVCAGIAMTLGAYTPVLSSFQLSIGNQVGQRKDLNDSTGLVGVSIRGRQPSGSIDPEVDTLANFNPWNAWRDSTKAAIVGTLGTVSGNKIKVTVPKAQYGVPKYADRDGILAYQLGFTPTIDTTGDDELKLEYL